MTNGCKCRHRKSGSNEKSTAQQNRRSDTKKSEVQHSRDRIWRNGSRSKTQCENSPESVASEHAWAPHSWRQRGLCVCVLRTRLFELQGQCQPNAKLYWRSLSESCMATWKNENGEKLKEAACKSWICHGSFSRAWVRKHVQEFSH